MKVAKLKERAAELDASEAPAEAAAAYEELILSGGAELETYLDLAGLYFCCTDFGYLSYHRLDDDFVRYAFDRAREILDQAERRFGRHNEVDFWRYYFDWIGLGSEENIEATEEWVREGPSPIPLFHLLMLSSGDSVLRAAEELLESIQPVRTERLRYVASVLESTIISIDPRRALRARRKLREERAREEEK